MTTLAELVRGLGPTELTASAAKTPVSDVCFDSRAVVPGSLFIAIQGHSADGHAHAAAAVAAGAVAVVAERPVDVDAPVVLVESSREALATIAGRFHNHPSQEVRVVGITGTNGKTTTSFLLRHILRTLGERPSMLGTVTNEIAGVEQVSTQTTPDPLTFQRSLAETRRAGARTLVAEVSSHALDQARVAGVRFQVGVFTNLSQDHLDYHGSLENYMAAKQRLFEMLPEDGIAVLNGADPVSIRYARSTRAEVVRFGFKRRDELCAEVARQSLEGSELCLWRHDRPHRLMLPLIGRHNIENALAALLAAEGLGYSIAEAAQALASTPGVPGRLERVSAPGEAAVLVDYAHTPDALDRVLATLRPLTRGRLHVVFGCGGDRDRGKRPQMGAAVARWADSIVLTSDNPRSEDPSAIADDVKPGFGRHRYSVVLDRREAIAAAIARARPKDLVLIAGKGHESGQSAGGIVRPFDDRVVARELLGGRAAASRSGARSRSQAA